MSLDSSEPQTPSSVDVLRTWCVQGRTAEPDISRKTDASPEGGMSLGGGGGHLARILCLLSILTEVQSNLGRCDGWLLVQTLNYSWNGKDHPRQLIQTGCVYIWAFRLGLFLFTRVMKTGHDRRFKKAIQQPSLLWVYWTLQGVWVLVTLLPSLLAIKSSHQRAVGTRDYLGWGLWVIGFVTEVMADYQKTAFRNDPANKDKFISSGLWSLSRHPNYFGEILLWFGLYISASSTFTGWEYLSVMCPVLDYLLITRVSGIPMLEKYGHKKWGTSPQYQQYVANTPILVPFIGKSH